MKTLKLTLIAALLLAVGSCKKTDTSGAVTADIATDMAAASLSQNSFGLTSVTDNVIVNAQTLNSINTGGQAVNSVGTNATTTRQACGTTLADSVSNSGSNSSVTFSFFIKYLRTLNCNTASQPDNLVNAITFHGNYDSPRITSTDAGSANFTIAGLTTNATNYVINGEYIRKGSFTSKVDTKATGSSSIDIKVTNLLLSKPGRAIVSGTATITISGTSAKGTFSYTGAITFTGGTTASLTVGTVLYYINLLDGTFHK
jgi:hypothetical protein